MDFKGLPPGVVYRTAKVRGVEVTQEFINKLADQLVHKPAKPEKQARATAPAPVLARLSKFAARDSARRTELKELRTKISTIEARLSSHELRSDRRFTALETKK